MNNLIYKKNLELQTLENIKNSKAINTVRAYKSDFDHFKNFCKKNECNPENTDIKTISIYLTYLSNKNYSFSTIRRRLVSINLANKLSGNNIDIKHPIIDENLKSIKRKIGAYQKSKRPILLNELDKIVKIINKNKSDLKKKRDKTLILLGFSGGFRRSEIVSLNVEDIEFVSEGAQILLKRSKTDQYGKGFLKGIPYFSNLNICPIVSLQEWLKSSTLSKGPIFRKISKSNKILDKRLTDQTVALIIKKYIGLAGFNNNNFSGHSLRSGFATVAASLGANERSIMNMTGHKSTTMVRRYIRETNIFNNNALKGISKL